MTPKEYHPTRETLKLAALACGKAVSLRRVDNDSWWVVLDSKGQPKPWQPHLSTTQGKADLLDMMLALDVSFARNGKYVDVFIEDEYFTAASVLVINGDKHAALAESVIKVAAMVGAKMKGGV